MKSCRGAGAAILHRRLARGNVQSELGFVLDRRHPGPSCPYWCWRRPDSPRSRHCAVCRECALERPVHFRSRSARYRRRCARGCANTAAHQLERPAPSTRNSRLPQAKDDFLHHASHEMRNPLSALRRRRSSSTAAAWPPTRNSHARKIVKRQAIVMWPARSMTCSTCHGSRVAGWKSA